MEFSERLNVYLEQIKRVKTEASKGFYFLEFIRNVFSKADIQYIHVFFPYLEKYLKNKEGTLAVKGRADALLGNLIIEFKDKLDYQKLEEAKNGLRKYIAIIWSNEKHKTKYLLIATDGTQIYVFRPKLFREELFDDSKRAVVKPEKVSLEFISRINLNKADPDYAYVWLDSYLLYKELQTPTTERFLETFGKMSPVYSQAIGILKDKWNEVKSQPQIDLLFNEWSKYLEIVYGSRVKEEDLFLRHTYLATLSKLIADIFYSGGAIPSPEQITSILSGDSFIKWGIQNFLEIDFFSWVLRIEKQFIIQFCKHLIRHIRSFDVTKLDEDVIKGLYQELVDPKERHDLGEYYTPDWLAEYITRELIINPDSRVLDPACGSGTFLVSVIKLKKRQLQKEGLNNTEILNKILSQVVGIDIHPLAVITSKVNYILALGELIEYKKEPISIPVYLADSIRLPEEVKLLEVHSKENIEKGIPVYEVKLDGVQIQIPSKIVKSSNISDLVFNLVRQIVDEEIVPKNIRFFLIQKIPIKLTNLENKILLELIEKLRTLKNRGKDSIWTYVWKNIYKPIFLSRWKFDYLIGNPPWIAYRFLGTDYQEFVKEQIIKMYQLLPSEKVELMTHMEVATLFFSRGSHLYLKDKGKIGFVMPRGIFSSDQHEKFRSGKFFPQMKIEKIFDLEKVSPLFNINACVVFGSINNKTKYPIKGKHFSGKLKNKNTSFDEAKNLLKIVNKKYYLNKIGKRTFLLDRKIQISPKGSNYKRYFNQGASLVPRNFWFVNIQKHKRFGLDPNKPNVVTSQKIIKYAKPPYKEVIFEDNIEKQFLYATLRGSEVVPFAHLPFLITVLPVMKKKNKFKIINEKEAKELGYIGLSNWIFNAESKWHELRGSKAEKNTAVEWLNYRNKLTEQNHNIRFKVLYLTSGTYIASCLIDLKKDNLDVDIDGINIPLNGFVADTKTYYYETDNADEAYFLSSVLNAPIVDNLIKGMQSRGLFGPRDIHKKVLDLPIPDFNSQKSTHVELAKFGRKCKKKAESILPSLSKQYNSIGVIRRKIRDELKTELEKISELVLKAFSETVTHGTLDRWK